MYKCLQKCLFPSSFSECTDFENNVTLTADIISVNCKDVTNNQTIYNNTHAPITLNSKTQEKFNGLDNSKKPLSILIVAIDSMSRLNLIRTLPRTYQFLKNNDWIELKGYNKIEENTFPNVMGLLAGMNKSSAYRICQPHFLENCNFIYHNFNSFNYVTAYAEDESFMNTFYYNMYGFKHPPMDYYFRYPDNYLKAIIPKHILRKQSKAKPNF